MADRAGRAVALALVAVAVTTLAGCLDQSAADPVPSRASSTGSASPVASSSPVSPSLPISTPPPAWTGPVRSGASWPVVFSKRMGPPSDPWFGWVDPRDATVGWVDIRLMSGFGFELRTRFPAAPMTERLHRIKLGVVVDTDGDGVADCQIGLDNHVPWPAYRVWLKNLHSGVTVKSARSDRPPVGWQMSEGVRREPAFVRFGYAGGARSLPCDPFHGPASYYAYAAITQNGRVTAWDYAPDAAWLRAAATRSRCLMTASCPPVRPGR